MLGGFIKFFKSHPVFCVVSVSVGASVVAFLSGGFLAPLAVSAISLTGTSATAVTVGCWVAGAVAGGGATTGAINKVTEGGEEIATRKFQKRIEELLERIASLDAKIKELMSDIERNRVQIKVLTRQKESLDFLVGDLREGMNKMALNGTESSKAESPKNEKYLTQNAGQLFKPGKENEVPNPSANHPARDLGLRPRHVPNLT